jgi:hypothetical protein
MPSDKGHRLDTDHAILTLRGRGWSLDQVGQLFSVSRQAIWLREQKIGVADPVPVDQLPTSPDLITDAYSFYSARCPKCGGLTMRVVRPGKCQCQECSG